MHIAKAVIEIILLWTTFYALILYVRRTRAINVIKGIVLLFVLILLSKLLRLDVINWIGTKILPISAIAFVVLFQPEMRRALARLGQGRLFGTLKETDAANEIVRSAVHLSQRKIGALIAIERQTGLRPYMEGGMMTDSKLSSELLNTIFMPNAPLHDGAVIIQEDRIAACACMFPLTQSPYVSKTMGTRHRAAIGLTEETDAVCVIVSEETGEVSMAIGGELTSHLDENSLRNLLRRSLYGDGDSKTFFKRWRFKA